jgi:uncharacterized membrane protein YphA (DoxX/SURF4 family)
MTVVRRLARPMMSATFIASGLETLRHPDPAAADHVAPVLAERVPYLPDNPESVVKLVGGVQVGAGLLLALGRFPRLSAALLAGSLVPTTLAEHRFWEETDQERKATQRSHFLKNLALLGGLVLAAIDTEGRPGLAWRARHASHHAAAGTRRTRRAARREAKLATRSARAHLPH